MFLRRSFNLCLHKLVICQHKKENPEENLLKCSHCSYTASASAVLKRPVTMNHKTFESVIKVLCEDCGLKFTSNANMEEHRVTKHKPITPVKEIERYETPNDSLVLSLSKEERSENCSTSFSFHIETPSPTAEPLSSSPTSPETQFEKCAFISCSNPATQFFSSTKVHNARYKDLLICH